MKFTQDEEARCKTIDKNIDRMLLISDVDYKGLRQRFFPRGGYQPAKGTELTPEELRLIFEDYKSSVVENPAKAYDMIKGGERAGEIVEMDQSLPYSRDTFIAFCGNLGLPLSMIRRCMNPKTCPEDHEETAIWIDATINGRTFDGGMAGVFKESLAAKALGLAERREIETTNKNAEAFDYSKLSQTELDQLDSLMNKARVETED